MKLGDTFDVELFNDDTWLDVRGISKGKGITTAVISSGFIIATMITLSLVIMTSLNNLN